MKQIFIIIQHISPQHLLSRLAGFLADLESLKSMKNIAISTFIRVFGVDMEEAEEPDYRRYASFNAFFTRALRAGARPLADGDIACPADGTLSQCGDIEQGQLLQAKGRHFSAAALLGDEQRARVFDAGAFATIYLSPRDYHRVHMPLAGRLTGTTYIPGRLFSVNAVTAEGVDRLFARNERLVCYFDTAVGPMAMVLVGAMIVAGIETVWSGRAAPRPRSLVHTDFRQLPEPVELERGEEMGRFCLGSTVILLFPRETLSWRDSHTAGSSVRMGAALGDFIH